jgi:hypothetical protein
MSLHLTAWRLVAWTMAADRADAPRTRWKAPQRLMEYGLGPLAAKATNRRHGTDTPHR